MKNPLPYHPNPQLDDLTRGHRIGSRILAVIVLAAALAVPNWAAAQVPTFNTVIKTPTGSQPWQPPRPAAVGDFNNDGKLDALIADSTAALRYLRGNGDGTFARSDIGLAAITATNTVDLPAGLLPYLPKGVDGYGFTKAADLNADGWLDAVSVMGAHINWGPYNFMTVSINNGNDASGVPQFVATHYFLPFSDVRSLTTGDLNGDGSADFIVGGAYGQLQVYLSNGNGTFTRGQLTGLSSANSAVAGGAIADLNGDGKADFVVTTGQGTGSTDVFFGNGLGTLQAPVSIANLHAGTIAVADVNNDGSPDLLEGLGDGSVSVFLNNGNGTFGSPTAFTTVASGGVSGFFMSDVNGDGKLDAALSLVSAGQVVIALGNGDGTFGASYSYGGIPNAQDVTLADFTGDGKVDIGSVSAAGYGGQTFALLTNTTVFLPPAQLFFTDSLAGPASPNLAAIPAGKYGHTAAGLQRTQSSGTTDRPMVTTARSTYLTAANFTAEVTVKLVNNDLLYFGLGQGNADPGYFNEPNNAFYFRVHSGWQGNTSIQADARSSSVFTVNQVGSYTLGSTITLRIVRAGDIVTMSVLGGGSVTYSLAAYPSLGLNNANTRVFFGNSSVGSVFSDLKIYEAIPDTTAPVIAVPANVTVEATGPAGAVVTFAATAVDGVDGAVPVVALPASGSTFPLGVTTVDLGASDVAGNIATGSFTVTVRDTTPPVITPPANVTVEATSPAGAAVAFAAGAVDLVSGTVPVLALPASGSTFPLGVTTVDLGASDAAGNIGTASFTVTVRDTTAPVLAGVTPSTASIWPPNHKMVPISVTATASDAVGVASLKIISVTSNEPDDGLGDGDTANDIEITGALTVNLRAERGGKGDGRVYTITVEARDAAGNASTMTTTVTVPKNQGKKG